MTDSGNSWQTKDGNFPPEIFQAMLNVTVNPEIVACVRDAQEVLACNLPESERKSFLIFHDFVTNPQPRFITDWRSSPREEKWYLALVEGLNGATRNAYACVHYHFQRLSKLESDVMEKISKRNYVALLENATLGIGNTLIWDFEYQAFVFAYRRCLDYLTRGLAAFFKQTFHSFSELPKKLRNQKPKNVADALADVHGRHCVNLEFVMSADGRRSVRDKIAHYEWVNAGVINLNRHGFTLVGGGEALPFTVEQNTARLTEALATRVRMLKACIDEMLATFVTEARVWEATRGS